MPLPGSDRDLAHRKFLSEVAEPDQQKPVFLQEIKEPMHEVEVLVEKDAKKNKKSRSKK
jgi:hypothetical protein